MAQSVQLAVSGLYTAPSDYAGLPAGALDEAQNVESRHKNILESRRGFESLPGSAHGGVYFKRLTNFPVVGVDRIVGLTSAGDLEYYDAAGDAMVALDGDSSGLVDPNALAKGRFNRGGQNLYITDQSGVLSLASGSGSDVLPAGVPKGLNCEAATTGSSGFFTNNVAASTTGTVTSASPTITSVLDISDIAVGQYISASGVTVGTTVAAIVDAAQKLVTTGNLAGGTAVITGCGTAAGLLAGDIVSVDGIPEGTTILSIAGTDVTVSAASVRTVTGATVSFSSPPHITMSANATGSHASTPISFYVGSQVGYRVLFGRVETDILGNTTTRYGAPSAMAVATNVSDSDVNVTVTATLPKNSEHVITFVQLFRSQQTATAAITPLDQMQLAYERELVHADFAARTVSITDIAPDSTLGIPLYTGTDREGILQANLPPPSCWDLTFFRNIGLYANCTQPSSVSVTLTAVGSPSGLQSGDTITVVAGLNTSVYTAAGSENAASKQFKVSTGGTASQNIEDTVNSLIRVVNYDESMPVHVILTSTTTDLPGQMVFESDVPYGSFTITASAHATAYNPTLTALASNSNYYNNGVFVSKSGELESVPGANILRVGDSSSPIYRIIALRDYVVVLKGDGVYKILGNTPNNLSVQPFDLTTKIIGPDTAVQLNSGVWMMSNQGVVSIDDAGVNAKSPPIDNILNELIGSVITGLNETAFAVGYESDRKYILAVPQTDDDLFCQDQFVFNYVTNSWTTWDRNVHTGFIHSSEGALYIGRADGALDGISKERKSGTYRDYSDEDLSANITSVTSTTVVVLDDVSTLSVGDILYQDVGVLSPISSIDLSTGAVTTQYAASWVVGAVTILTAIACTVKFKQVFGDNPAFERQFSEGLALFKETRFNQAIMNFATDFSQSTDTVDLEGTLLTGWGLEPWGSGPWGGTSAPSSIRFYVPALKQLGSYIIPTLMIQQAWSTWKFQGLSLSWSPISQEVGK